MKTKTKIVITCALAVLLLFSSLLISKGVSAVDFFSINGNKFGTNTYVGPFNISNQKPKLAKSEISRELSELHEKIEMNFQYQDYYFTVPKEIIAFDVESTIDLAQSSEVNPIIANVSRNGLAIVLQQELPFIQFTEKTIEAIASGAEKELESGLMPKNIFITDFMGKSSISNSKVASSVYTIDSVTTSLDNAIKALNGITVHPFELISLAELFKSQEIGVLSEEESTILASIVYSAILQTNFIIDERNISSVLTPTIQPGFEAAMDSSLGLDFKFSNPNKTTFTLFAERKEGEINFSIEGYQFYYTYSPNVVDIETYSPRTVIQYSAFIDKGEIVVKDKGLDGVNAEVFRTSSHDGVLIENEKIASDFYAPVSRIEMHALRKADSKETTNSNDANESVSGTDSNNDNAEKNTSPEDGLMQGSSEEEGSSNHKEVQEHNESANEIDKPVYDKSGLPLTGK